ncbi:ribokinase [Tetragenococcus solitarius]|uniref:Ribokinase n=1 Tax=Tetragenococcus solitarius TaxID=71453 RepID=A0ABN3Y5J3_9ENTE|nr:ribokinase [Tetragenococcus solitarius]
MGLDVVVMGSINMDMLVHVDDFPKYSENVVAKKLEVLAGGKGSNQAVTISKQDVKHAFLGAVGADDFGKQIIDMLNEKGVETKAIIRKTDAPTGTAVGIVDKVGENTFMGVLGANMALTAAEIEKAFENLEAKVFLLQLETSQESVIAALKCAKEKGMYIILDPAPEGCYFEESLSYTDLVTPNKQEAERITGIAIENVEDAKKAAKIIADTGVANVIVKLGGQGSVLFESAKDKCTFIEAKKVTAVNTVGAGDTFAGVLASELSRDRDNLVNAIQTATQASALKVARHGGHEAIPTRKEIMESM